MGDAMAVKSTFLWVSFPFLFDESIEQFLCYTYIGKALDGVLSGFEIFWRGLCCSFCFGRAWWLLLREPSGEFAVILLSRWWDGLGLGLPVDHTMDCGIEQMMVQIEYRVHPIIIPFVPCVLIVIAVVNPNRLCFFEEEIWGNISQMESIERFLYKRVCGTAASALGHPRTLLFQLRTLALLWNESNDKVTKLTPVSCHNARTRLHTCLCIFIWTENMSLTSSYHLVNSFLYISNSGSSKPILRPRVRPC